MCSNPYSCFLDVRTMLIISGPYSVFLVMSINSFIPLEVWLSITGGFITDVEVAQ